jgi:hypothetical protein
MHCSRGHAINRYCGPGACARKKKRAGKGESGDCSKTNGSYAQDVVRRNAVPPQLGNPGCGLDVPPLSFPDVVRIIPTIVYAEFDCASHKGRFSDI